MEQNLEERLPKEGKLIFESISRSKAVFLYLYLGRCFVIVMKSTMNNATFILLFSFSYSTFGRLWLFPFTGVQFRQPDFFEKSAKSGEQEITRCRGINFQDFCHSLLYFSFEMMVKNLDFGVNSIFLPISNDSDGVDKIFIAAERLRVSFSFYDCSETPDTGYYI